MVYGEYGPELRFDELVGKRIVEYRVESDPERGDRIYFTCSDGSRYIMTHCQDCCEVVEIEDICGSWHDILDEPIVEAYESKNKGGELPSRHEAVKNDWDCWTWTFYTLRTNKGTLTIRWVGRSNGYYSEEAGLYRLARGKEAD